MRGLAGLGYVAGGATQGYLKFREDERQQEDAERRKQEFDWRKEEQGRQEGLRRESANTFGNVGNADSDGNVYTEERAYADYAPRAAGIDPVAGQQARTAGAASKVQGYQLSGLADAERIRTQTQKVFADRQTAQKALDDLRTQAGGDPMAFVRGMAEWYSKVPNGESLKIGQDGTLFLSKDNDVGGITSHISAPGVLERIYSGAMQRLGEHFDTRYEGIGPQQRAEVEDRRLKGRTVTAQEATAENGRLTAQATADWRRDQGPVLQGQARVYNSQAEYYDRNRGTQGLQLNPLQDYQLGQQRQFDAARNSIITQLEKKEITEQEATRRLNMLNMRFGSGQVREPRATGLQPIKDNPGLFASPDGTEFFRYNESGGFTPVPTPMGLSKLGDAIRQNLPPRNAPPAAGGLPLPSAPPVTGSPYIRSTRGGYIVDPPNRSAVTGLRGRVYASREEAQAAIDGLGQ